ncbi:hypothetical protein R3P38DRAFT_2882953 [Favolaschia claudopus]|uniref:SSCRP protein n=1 Tax=Favolaschia claudopus TaxID=2862362 RepID=A0AAW0D2M8_9AGAR
MRFTSSFIALSLVAIVANAQDIIAWSGRACNGDEGLEVQCDGGCIDFTGRHSFKIFESPAKAVNLFAGANCSGERFAFGKEKAGVCINVQVGSPVQSLRCS